MFQRLLQLCVYMFFFSENQLSLAMWNKFAHPRPTCSHIKELWKYALLCAFRRLMCKDQRIQKKQLCGWKTNLWPCLFLLNRVVNTGGTSLTGQLWMKWVVESGVRSNCGGWWGRWISRHTFNPAQKHVTKCSSVLNIASFVWPMWRKRGTYGQCSCHGHDVLPRPRLWTVISPHAKCASDACGWKSAAVAKQPWRVARIVCGICSLFAFNELHLPSGKLT